MNVSFQPAQIGDVELVVQLMRELRRDDPDEGPFDEPGARRALPLLIQDRSLGAIWLMQADAQTVGYAAMTLGLSLELGGFVAFIDELYVRPAFRCRGIGSSAIEFVAGHAKSLGARSLLLEVTASNEAALRLYQRRGFVDRKHRLMSRKLV